MKNTPAQPPAYINHFAICVDASSSMARHASALVQAMDHYTGFLADLSKQQEQETRITVYTFASHGQEQCLFYDKDVLRIPSIKGLYHPGGMTALIDSTVQAIGEMEQTATLYGEHAFMVTVLSDGQENDSRRYGRGYAATAWLASRIAGLPDNWTTAAFGPDAHAVHQLKQCGFPAGNVSVWDTSSATGLEKVGEMMREASVSFMEGRKAGITGYNRRSGGLFQMRDFGTSEVISSLVPLTEGSYELLQVFSDGSIREFAEYRTGRPYHVGSGFYQLTKTEVIQARKRIAIQLADGRVYSGQAARGVLGLPDHEVKVRPDYRPGITIFVESTSYNRKLIGGTKLLLLR